MLTLESFEEAAEIVKQVTQETKLVKSSYFSELTGNKVSSNQRTCREQVRIRCVELIIRSVLFPTKRGAKADHSFRWKSCTGCGICGTQIRCEGRDRNADHYTAY